MKRCFTCIGYEYQNHKKIKDSHVISHKRKNKMNDISVGVKQLKLTHRYTDRNVIDKLRLFFIKWSIYCNIHENKYGLRNIRKIHGRYKLQHNFRTQFKQFSGIQLSEEQFNQYCLHIRIKF